MYRNIAIALALPVMIAVLILSAWYGLDRYDRHRAREISRQIVLDEFDTWLGAVSEEHRHHYDALHDVALRDDYDNAMYWVIAGRMIEQTWDGSIDENEVETIIELLAVIEESESMAKYFFEAYEEPGFSEAVNIFLNMGARMHKISYNPNQGV